MPPITTAVQTTMPVFRKGTWIWIDTAFLAADRALTVGQRRTGAAVVGSELARGKSLEVAERVAEKKVYASAYPGLSWDNGGVAGK